MTAVLYLTFRLRGLPRTYVDESSVQQLIKTLFSIQPAGVTVFSLANSPVDSETRVATLSFRRVPLELCDNSMGLGGHAFGSFKVRAGPFMWLRDALPYNLPQARIFIYGFDTQLPNSQSFQSLDDLGKGFIDLALEAITTAQTSPSPQRRLILLGHSLGGLIVKAAMIQMHRTDNAEYKRILDSIAAFLLFGVPQQGMDIAALIPVVDNQPNRSLLDSLDKNSPLLRNQRTLFPAVFRSRSTAFFAFYETLKSPTAAKIGKQWKIAGPPTVLVDIPSATHGVKEDAQHPINRDHSDMVKFSSFHDEDYLYVLRILHKFKVGSSATPVRAAITPSTIDDPWIVELSAAVHSGDFDNAPLKERARAFNGAFGRLIVHIYRLPEAERGQFIRRLESNGQMLDLLHAAEEKFNAFQQFKKYLAEYNRARS
ncbi:hypothetical protein SLS55_002029 [Diplodia seriata]|uniref:DUF676 domain-containing protein n=1 Tax=Diplodia seriata TaxID=420778 RepID=A0ABR3CQZ5_9PEZI